MNALASIPYAEFGIQSNFSFLRGASKPEELVVAASCSDFPRSALPTATRWPAWCAPGSRPRWPSFAYHPGCRLVFSRRHARHPRLSAGPQGLGASLPHADPGQSARRKREGRSRSAVASDLLEWGDLLSLAVLPDLDGGRQQDAGLAAPAEGPLRRCSVRLAVAPAYGGNDRFRLEQAAALAAAAGLPLMAINDVLYHTPERRPLQDVVTAIRLNIPVAAGGLRTGSQCRAPSEAAAEMARLFRRHPAGAGRDAALCRRAWAFR